MHYSMQHSPIPQIHLPSPGLCQCFSVHYVYIYTYTYVNIYCSPTTPRSRAMPGRYAIGWRSRARRYLSSRVCTTAKNSRSMKHSTIKRSTFASALGATVPFYTSTPYFRTKKPIKVANGRSDVPACSCNVSVCVYCWCARLWNLSIAWTDSP